MRQSADYQGLLAFLRATVAGLFETLHVCEIAATRWPDYAERYLFPRHKDDIGEAAMAAQLSIDGGALNPARRELRHMLEVAVNVAFVDERASKLDLDERTKFFRSKQVNKRNVDHVRNLPLRMLGSEREDFVKATCDAWSKSSNYVHLTKLRIDEKVRLRAQGIGVGLETTEMLAEVVQDVHDACSIVVVLALETVGPAFAGDILLAGNPVDYERWPFHKSRFVATVDAHFDDKHERQADLANHVARRERLVSRPKPTRT